jgi:hypothetical protein
MNDIKSLKDLSNLISTVHEEYHINNFLLDLKKCVLDLLPKDKSHEVEVENNPITLITMIEDKESLETVLKKVKTLSEKYKFEDYSTKCIDARNEFFSKRKNYYFSKLNLYGKLKKTATMQNELDGTYDSLYSRWVDNELKENRKEKYCLTYEDLDGSIKKIITQKKKLELSLDFVEAPPIDRFVGMCFYDKFLLHSFWCLTRKEWVYVPIRLIKSIKLIRGKR